MEYFWVGLTTTLASLLTFYSGFGLGTILTPVFAIFFPIEQAIALTGVVHFLNNLFKTSLIGKKIDFKVLLRFGAPAIVGAFAGAMLLERLSFTNSLGTYQLFGHRLEINLVELVVGSLMVFFASMEHIPAFKKRTFGKAALIPGGILSGFFGGLSGHQGALRSMFLLKCGLSKEGFIATGIAIACLVDITRLTVYIPRMVSSNAFQHWPMILTGTLCAFAGAYAGRQLIKKITLKALQMIVTIMIILFGIALASGMIGALGK